MWEVSNETLGRSKKKDELSSFFSAPDFIEWNYKTAAKYFTSNRLVINDNNPNVMVNHKGTGSAYYKLIKDALGKGCRIDGIGIQSHWLWKLGDKSFGKRVKTLYDPQFMFGLLDTYAKFGKPIQITEITIPAFSTDSGDEAVQAEIVRNLYSIWFSHKAMEAIIYWDFTDAYTWLPKWCGALCRSDMSPKPAYKAICDLFGREWRTNFERDAAGGRLSFRGFCGTYEVEATSNGRTVKREFHVGRENPAPVKMAIA
jgi:GH35 family endo-1,4-beta-xylanase